MIYAKDRNDALEQIRKQITLKESMNVVGGLMLEFRTDIHGLTWTYRHEIDPDLLTNGIMLSVIVNDETCHILKKLLEEKGVVYSNPGASEGFKFNANAFFVWEGAKGTRVEFKNKVEAECFVEYMNFVFGRESNINTLTIQELEEMLLPCFHLLYTSILGNETLFGWHVPLPELTVENTCGSYFVIFPTPTQLLCKIEKGGTNMKENKMQLYFRDDSMTCACADLSMRTKSGYTNYADIAICGESKLLDIKVVPPAVDRVDTYNDRVVKVTFVDGSFTKAVCSPKDHFDLDTGITICVMKKMLGEDGNARYNNMLRNIHNRMEANEKRKIKMAERKTKRIEAQKKAESRNKAAREKARREAIDIQKQAYVEAMKEVSDS